MMNSFWKCMLIGMVILACATWAHAEDVEVILEEMTPLDMEAAPTVEVEEETETRIETQKENPVVIIKTSKGDITAELFKKEAPVTVENFLQYVDDGFFAGTIFHRVIPNFMIQGGGFTPDMAQKSTRDPIRNEADNGLKNERGTLAMARTSVIDSATSQFFINVADNAFLNHTGRSQQGFGYAVFGRVIDGMDVVDAIVNVPRGRSGPHGDVPREPIEIIEVIRQ